MLIWIDAQLAPSLASWLEREFGIQARSLLDLGLLSAADSDIFFAARQANAIVLTKDSDFVDLLSIHGPPPKILWLTCGNTSNAALHVLLKRSLSQAIDLLSGGEDLVELGD